MNTIAVFTHYVRSFKIWVNENKDKFPEGTTFLQVCRINDVMGVQFAGVRYAHGWETVNSDVIEQAKRRVRNPISNENDNSWMDETWE